MTTEQRYKKAGRKVKKKVKFFIKIFPSKSFSPYALKKF